MIEFALEHEDIVAELCGYQEWLTHVAALHSYYISNITYVLTSDEQVLKLNKAYLKHDFYTDVLTFDRSENKELSADIFISLDRVKENAAAFDVSFDEELRRVMVHGLLHMVGYGDDDDMKKEQMRRAEDEALELFHVKQ